MEKKHLKLGIAVAVLIGIWLVWNVNYPSETWRYKMTVVVDTPEGPKSGSAVRKVTVGMKPEISGLQGSSDVNLRGEAVVVDMGKRGFLFAVMRGNAFGEDYASHIILRAFPFGSKPSGGRFTAEAIQYYSTLHNARKSLDISLYPTLVHFSDINDPKTAEAVLVVKKQKGTRNTERLYEIKEDRFSDFYGEGVALREIVIEMTNESVTEEIYDALPWLKATQRYLGGNRNSRDVPMGLHRGHFKRG